MALESELGKRLLMGRILTASGNPDPRPERRIRNPQLLKELHLLWRECALCRETWPLSLHHIVKHPRNDVQANLVMLCGDGVQGCHGKIEAHDEETLKALGEHILEYRHDTILYLYAQLGTSAAQEWMKQHFIER